VDIAAGAAVADRRPSGDDRARPPLGADLCLGPDVQEALPDLERFDERTYYDDLGDERAKAAYYGDFKLGDEPAENYRRLSALVQSTHQRQLKYRPLSHVYPWVDLHPDRTLRSIYSGKTFTPEQFIREDAAIEVERTRLIEGMRPVLAEAVLSDEQREAMLEMLESSMPYNCEHLVSQSWFGKAEPMRGDLHHLFACEAACSSFRGNFP
jgi:endonuclease G, mitochondrial